MRLLYSSDIYKLIDDLYEVYLFNYNYYVVTEFYLYIFDIISARFQEIFTSMIAKFTVKFN